MHRDRPPLAADVVLGPVRPLDHGRAERRDRRPLHQGLRQLRHRVVVGVGLVRLEHGELGVVGGVDPLVPEVPPDLEDRLDPADDEPLQVQLERDPHVHLRVVGVEVRLERPRVGPAVGAGQHRRLDFHVAPPDQLRPHRLDHGRPHLGQLPGPRVDDQVHVALPDPRLGVGQPGVLVGQRPQRLGGDRERVRQHRQLAGPRRDDLPGHPDVVAQIDVPLPRRQRFLAHARERDHHLDVPGSVAQGGEAELAADPGQDDAARDARGRPGRGVRRQGSVLVPQQGHRRRPRVAHRIGVDSG